MTVPRGIQRPIHSGRRIGASIASRFQTVREVARTRQQKLKEHILRIPGMELTVRATREMMADDGPHLAAGVAYYALLSLFPLMLGLIAILGLILPSESVQQDLVDFFEEYLPASVDVLNRNIGDVIRLRGPTGLVSLVLLLWSASTVFGAVSRVINRAFFIRQDRAFVKRKLRDMSMALGVGLLVLLSVGATSIISILKSLDVDVPSTTFDIVARFLGIIISFGIFLILYKFVPNTKIYWRFVWPGAFLAAVLFEIAKNLFLLYLSRFADYESIYGSVGPIVALILWLYISAFILMLGAEFSSEYGRMKGESSVH